MRRPAPNRRFTSALPFALFWALPLGACAPRTDPAVAAELALRTRFLRAQPVVAFAPTMAGARSGHTLTPLATGKVLVLGGAGATPAAELFDPVTGTFSTAAAPAVARWVHTATLMRDGRVFVIGGWDSSTSTHLVVEVELYDPATDAWAAAGSLADGRANHTATLLPSGRVLVTGDYQQTGLPALLFDGSTGWSTVADPQGERYWHTATRLADGRVLVAGGTPDMGATEFTDAEIFDEATRTFTPVNPMSVARAGHSATVLPDGRVFVAGGRNSVVTKTAEIFDPATGTWSMAPPFVQQRFWHAAGLFPDGSVFLGLGQGSSGTVLGDGEVFLWPSGTWSPLAYVYGTPRVYPTATILPTGRLLLAGGSAGASGPQNTALVLDPLSPGLGLAPAMAASHLRARGVLLPDGAVLAAGESTYGLELFDGAAWKAIVVPGAAQPSLPTLSLLASGRVLIAGGELAASATDGAMIFEPPRTVRAIAPLPSPRKNHAAVVLADGRVLVTGGVDASLAPTAEADVFDPTSEAWSQARPMTTPRASHAATLLADGRVLVTGGAAGLASAELWDPSTGSWHAAAMLDAHESHTSTLLPDGRVLVVGFGGNGVADAELFDPATESFGLTAGAARQRIDHTARVLRDGEVLLTGGIQPGPGSFQENELFDPITGKFSLSPRTDVRRGHASTLLLDGTVLHLGGTGGTGAAASETFDEGRRAPAASVPSLGAFASPVQAGAAVVLSGKGFTGVGDASGSDYRGGAANFPLFHLLRVDNERYSVVPVTDWTDVSAVAHLPANLTPGWHLGWVVVNGVPSASQPLLVAPSPPGSDGGASWPLTLEIDPGPGDRRIATIATLTVGFGPAPGPLADKGLRLELDGFVAREVRGADGGVAPVTGVIPLQGVAAANGSIQVTAHITAPAGKLATAQAVLLDSTGQEAGRSPPRSLTAAPVRVDMGCGCASAGAGVLVPALAVLLRRRGARPRRA